MREWRAIESRWSEKASLRWCHFGDLNGRKEPTMGRSGVENFPTERTAKFKIPEGENNLVYSRN